MMEVTKETLTKRLEDLKRTKVVHETTLPVVRGMISECEHWLGVLSAKPEEKTKVQVKPQVTPIKPVPDKKSA